MFTIVTLRVKYSRQFDLCAHGRVLQLRIKHAGASVLSSLLYPVSGVVACMRAQEQWTRECGGSNSQSAASISRLLGRTVRSVQDTLHKAKQAK